MSDVALSSSRQFCSPCLQALAFESQIWRMRPSWELGGVPARVATFGGAQRRQRERILLTRPRRSSSGKPFQLKSSSGSMCQMLMSSSPCPSGEPLMSTMSPEYMSSTGRAFAMSCSARLHNIPL